MPKQDFLAGYHTNRDFTRPPEEGDQDLGVEGLLYIPKEDSPVQEPLLVSCNEISGTTRIYRIHTK